MRRIRLLELNGNRKPEKRFQKRIREVDMSRDLLEQPQRPWEIRM